MELFVGNMWWAPTGRTIQQTMNEISEQGINVIRLPIAPQTLDPYDPQGKGDAREGGALKNDVSVRSMNARRALEDFIVLADKNDLQVIIDIHSCSNYVGWRAGRLDASPPYVDANRDNYEYTREDYSCGPAGAGVTVHEYNESRWLENLKEIAGLSSKLGVDNILAIDIFNEPWDYTWSEWKALAESAFEAINSVNSNVLIMVEGIGSETSNGTAIPHGDENSNPNWGENHFPLGNDPLNIPKDRLILSPHTYGPSVYVQRQFMDPAQPECAGLEGDQAGDARCNIVIDAKKLEAGWEEHFGYLKDLGYAVVIGEFGGNYEWPTGAAQRDQDRWSYISNNVDEEWQNAFVDYMIKKGIEACYWSINPESGDTGGLYLHAYDPISNTEGWGTWLGLDYAKLDLLKRLWNDSP
jgi:aryl-phospho-beta-D-glucosidase BglC (GH1 family)